LITSRAETDSPDKKRNRYAFAENVAQNGSVVLAESLAPQISNRKNVIEYTYKLIEKTSPKGIIGASKGMAERQSRLHVLNTFKNPALIVAGQEDQIIPSSDARNMAERLEKAVFLSIPHACHMPMMETPGVLAKALLNLSERAAASIE